MRGWGKNSDLFTEHLYFFEFSIKLNKLHQQNQSKQQNNNETNIKFNICFIIELCFPIKKKKVGKNVLLFEDLSNNEVREWKYREIYD